MMKLFLQICRASLFAGLALFSPIVWSGLLPTVTVAQQSRSKTINSILGVKIGTGLDEARAKLNPLGSSDGRATREGGRKEAWTLKETDFASVALKTNAAGRVVWVTGFLRPGKEIPFTELGAASLAEIVTDSQAIWNVALPGGVYRLVAKGPGGKARVVYLLSLATEPPE